MTHASAQDGNKVAECERNPGITVDTEMNGSKKHIHIMNKAKCILGYNRICKASRLREVVTASTKHW